MPPNLAHPRAPQLMLIDRPPKISTRHGPIRMFCLRPVPDRYETGPVMRARCVVMSMRFSPRELGKTARVDVQADAPRAAAVSRGDCRLCPSQQAARLALVFSTSWHVQQALVDLRHRQLLDDLILGYAGLGQRSTQGRV